MVVSHYTLCSNFSILVHSGSTIIHTGDEFLYHDYYGIVINLACNNRVISKIIYIASIHQNELHAAVEMAF